MLSLIDCLDFIDLDRNTIEVIAEHEHLPLVLATELGNELLKTQKGIYRLHQMYRTLMADAAERSLLNREKTLRQAYTQFSRKYPMPRHL